MPNISSIGAGIYTSLAYIDLDVQDGAGDSTHVGRGDDVSVYAGLFETRSSTSGLNAGDKVTWTKGTDAAAFGRIREFPNLGIPANVVNVPQYGQGASSQIAGQSDAPSLDFTFNYVPTEHAFISTLRDSGENRLFRIRLSNAQQVEDTSGVILPFETVDGAGSDMREFSDFFLFGAVASFEIVPNLTDSNQLNVTLTIDGEMRGPSSYTPDAVLANAPVYA
jgi:hypothetical protein